MEDNGPQMIDVDSNGMLRPMPGAWQRLSRPAYRLGVVLAGGKASRMPNKPLLPLPDGSFLCKSALDYLVRQGVDHIVVVIGEEDLPLRRVLRLAIGEIGVSYVADPCTGIVDALRVVANKYTLSQQMMIVCCDNVYPIDDPIWTTDRTNYECAIVRALPNDQAQHLDTINVRRDLWLPREMWDPSQYSLTTPWIINADRFRGTQNSDVSLITLLNYFKIPAIVADLRGWADLGTEESYYEYWKNYVDRRGRIHIEDNGSERYRGSEGVLWKRSGVDAT